MRRVWLILVGIDMTSGKWLAEIALTAPTGIVAIGEYDGADLIWMLWHAIKRRLRWNLDLICEVDMNGVTPCSHPTEVFILFNHHYHHPYRQLWPLLSALGA